MKLLITGICGFVGKTLALELKQRVSGLEVFGLDNLSRSGSELIRGALRTAGSAASMAISGTRAT
jgi:CDP-paratose 2-epimerase